MKVLIDFHHEDLFFSLHLLFSKRLGWDVYRPIGLEWYHEKFWNVFPALDTAQQYLGINTAADWDRIKEAKADEYCTFPNDGAVEQEEGVYYIEDQQRSAVYKGITLPKFKDTEFDIVVSSMPPHAQCFKRLVQLYQPRAKHIFQSGNNWNLRGMDIDNFLISSKASVPRHGSNFVYYHQEFDLERFKPVEGEKNPRSVVNLLHHMSGRSKQHFESLEREMPDWNWKAYGSLNRDGPVTFWSDIAPLMQNTGFLWHYKEVGDGYGYNIHHAMACGLPVITKKSFFRGMTVEPLLEDKVTCIDLDRHDNRSTIELLNEAANNYNTWSSNVSARFKEVVDFDAEFEQIKTFLENLK